MTTSPSSVPDAPAPLFLAASQPTDRDRLTVALRLIWVLPQVFVLIFVFIGAFFVLVLGWFGALFTGRLPTFASDFLAGAIRWGTRVSGYFLFLTDEYPPFSLEEDPAYPIKIAIPPSGELNRLAVLLRIFLVIPASIVYTVVGSGVFLIAVASWATITYSGKQPTPLYEAIRVVTRYHMRVSGYFLMLGEFQRSLQRSGHDDRVNPNSEPLERSSWQVQHCARASAKRYALALRPRSH